MNLSQRKVFPRRCFMSPSRTRLCRIVRLRGDCAAHGRGLLAVLADPERDGLGGGGQHLHEGAAPDRLLVPQVLGRDPQLRPDPPNLVDLVQRAPQQLLLLEPHIA